MKRPGAKKRPSQKRQTSDDGALIRRFSGALPVASAQASAQVSAWLASLKSKAAGKALTTLNGDYPLLGPLLGGIAEAAPFLWDLVRADPARFIRLLEHDPDAALAALLAGTQNAAAAARSRDELMRTLRGMKTEAALLIALADIGGVWAVARVTAALTDVAECALACAVHYLLREAVTRNKLAPPHPGQPEAGSGYIVLAMGKMGGHELN